MSKYVTLPSADGELMHVNAAAVTYIRERTAQSGCRVFFDKEHSFAVKYDAAKVIKLLEAAMAGADEG